MSSDCIVLIVGHSVPVYLSSDYSTDPTANAPNLRPDDSASLPVWAKCWRRSACFHHFPTPSRGRSTTARLRSLWLVGTWPLVLGLPFLPLIWHSCPISCHLRHQTISGFYSHPLIDIQEFISISSTTSADQPPTPSYHQLSNGWLSARPLWVLFCTTSCASNTQRIRLSRCSGNPT